jgi:hypothetical protein
MEVKFSLSLLLYSGRENPTVVITEFEFNSILSFFKNQNGLFNCSYFPKLGEIGFSLFSSGININLFSQISIIESNSKITYFHSHPEALKKTYNLFFDLYKGDDLELLRSIVKKSIFAD